jgi:hypothetical protein
MNYLILKREKIYHLILGVPRVHYVLLLTILLMVLRFILNSIYDAVEERDIIWDLIPPVQDKIPLFIISVTIGPLFETWIAQSLPYKLLNRIEYFKKRNHLILLISATFFGLNHFYSLFYMFYGFIMGMVIMGAYMIRIKSDNKTFYLIALSHALFNLSSYLKNIL